MASRLGCGGEGVEQGPEDPTLVAAVGGIGDRGRELGEVADHRIGEPPGAIRVVAVAAGLRAGAGGGEQAVLRRQVVQRGVGVQADPRGQEPTAQPIEVGGDDAVVGGPQIGHRRPRREQDEAERRAGEIEGRVLGPAAQRGQERAVVGDRHALVHAIELVLGEALDADEERGDRDPRGGGAIEDLAEPSGPGQEPVGPGLEQEREAADALGRAPREQRAEVAEGVLIAQDELGQLRRLAADVGELREDVLEDLGLGPRDVVVAGRAEAAAAAEPVGELDPGVARVGAGVGLVGTAGVAVDREHALGRQRVGVDDDRVEVGGERRRRLDRQRAQPGLPARGGAARGADRQARPTAGQVIEERVLGAGLDLIVARRIVQGVLAAPVDERRGRARRHQRLGDAPGPGPLVDDDVEAGQGRDQRREGRALGRIGGPAVEGDHHQLAGVTAPPGPPRGQRQGVVVEKRAIAVAVQADEGDPHHRSWRRPGDSAIGVNHASAAARSSSK
jgi:hypothetical protein